MSDQLPRRNRPRLRWGKRPLVALIAVVVALAAVTIGRAENIGFLAGSPAPSQASSGTPSAAASSTAQATPTPNDIVISDIKADHKNIVKVVNHHDGRLRVEGRVDLNRIDSSSTAPLNEAEAFGECIDCQTLAVAVQVNLIKQTATSIRPQNFAVAVNYRCQTCDTIAVALQFNITVADPEEIPSRVNQLAHEMNRELHSLRGRQTTLTAAIAEVNQVIGQYNDLVQYLEQLKHETTAGTDPGATPAPEDSPTPSASPGDGGTPSPSASPSTPAPTSTATPYGTTGAPARVRWASEPRLRR